MVESDEACISLIERIKAVEVKRGKNSVVRKEGRSLDLLRDEAEWEGRISPATTTDEFFRIIEDRMSGGKRKVFKSYKELNKYYDRLENDIDNETIRIKEQINESRLSRDEIDRAIEEVEISYQNETPSSELAEKELEDFFKKVSKELEKPKVEISPTKKGIDVKPTLKGNPLMNIEVTERGRK